MIQFTDMCKLIRFINQGIKHFFIINGEHFGDGCHEFKNRLPDSFTDSQFVAVLSRLSEEFTYSLVVHESFHDGEDVVLECHEGRARNLCSKVCRLAFAKSQQSLTFLEDDLQRPSSGVYSVSFKESQVKVGRKQSAPRTSLATANEEQTDTGVRKDDVGTEIPALELPAVLLLAPPRQLLDNGRGCEVFAIEAVLGPSLPTFIIPM